MISIRIRPVLMVGTLLLLACSVAIGAVTADAGSAPTLTIDAIQANRNPPVIPSNYLSWFPLRIEGMTTAGLAYVVRVKNDSETDLTLRARVDSYKQEGVAHKGKEQDIASCKAGETADLVLELRPPKKPGRYTATIVIGSQKRGRSGLILPGNWDESVSAEVEFEVVEAGRLVVDPPDSLALGILKASKPPYTPNKAETASLVIGAFLEILAPIAGQGAPWYMTGGATKAKLQPSMLAECLLLTNPKITEEGAHKVLKLRANVMDAKTDSNQHPTYTPGFDRIVFVVNLPEGAVAEKQDNWIIEEEDGHVVATGIFEDADKQIGRYMTGDDKRLKYPALNLVFSDADVENKYTVDVMAMGLVGPFGAVAADEQLAEVPIWPEAAIRLSEREDLLTAPWIYDYKLWRSRPEEAVWYVMTTDFARATGRPARFSEVRAARGRIFDRAGRLLADNRVRLDACVDYGELKHTADKDRVVDVLCAVLGLSEEAVCQRLDPVNVVRHVPVEIKRDITFEQYAKLRVLEPVTPGLMPLTNFARRYPHGELAAQTLGYTGLVPRQEAIEQLSKESPKLEYDGRDVVGLTGLERTFEHELQGRKGWITVEVDNLGRRRRVLDVEHEPVPGSDVHTTLDVNLQRRAHEILGDRRGALVALDPRNGDILVLASTPSFDPNLFAIPRPAEALAAIEDLNTDKSRRLWNRCINDQRPLGSAFKVVVALAALNLPDEKLRITGETVFNCPGTFALGSYTWKCYHEHAHGDMTVVTAIKKSCNVFFYKTGHRIGREPIVSLAAAFGLGKPTGVPLPNERAGVNPTDEWRASDDWRARDYATWYPGYTVNLSIGQFPLEVTPLQVAQLYGAVAMDGVLFRPRLVARIVRPNGVEEFAPQSRRIELSAESLALVKEGLCEVTREGGTGYSAFRNLQHLNAAGKTSTAEVGPKDARTNLTWFIALAPADAPEIVVVVMVEEGETGGRTAAPLAAEFLEAYFGPVDE